MSHTELERLVSIATGESLHEVHRRGFGLVQPPDITYDPELCQQPPQTID
jgi:hypothetical protein